MAKPSDQPQFDCRLAAPLSALFHLPTNCMSYQSTNPATGETSQSFDEISDDQLETALETAATCFESWRDLTFSERAVIANKAAGILRSRIDEFARPVTLEMGKRFEEAQAEVELSANIIAYYAEHAEEFLAPEVLSPESGDAHIESEPLGVLFGVQPWNFPYYQLARFAGPNLMAGNVVMIKHSATVPQCALAFEKLWREAGAPAGAYTNLFVSYDQVNRAIDDPRVKGVALTGSEVAGSKVAERAGKNLKKTTLELGGNDAFIVLEDADLEGALKWALWAKMNNAGQCCIAAKRIIVFEEIADAFIERFKTAMEALVPGDPMDPATTLAPLSSETALTTLLEQVEQAIDAGATVITGGGRVDRTGAYMQATILTDIKPGNPAYREEFFGPVALMFRVKDEDEAVALANDSDYGLGGSIFTRDVERGERLASRIETGMVFINHPTWTASDLPFGGIKNSGHGRELSRQGIQEFVNKKLVRTQPIDAAV